MRSRCHPQAPGEAAEGLPREGMGSRAPALGRGSAWSTAEPSQGLPCRSSWESPAPPVIYLQLLLSHGLPGLGKRVRDCRDGQENLAEAQHPQLCEPWPGADSFPSHSLCSKAAPRAPAWSGHHSPGLIWSQSPARSSGWPWWSSSWLTSTAQLCPLGLLGDGMKALVRSERQGRSLAEREWARMGTRAQQTLTGSPKPAECLKQGRKAGQGRKEKTQGAVT